MDFFKSVFSPDQDPKPDNPTSSSASPDSNSNSNPNTAIGWKNIGGLIKTVASKSESVIQTYKRDLEEFGSGLKKETVIIREAASKTVEAASKTVDEIITHGKEILAVDSGNDGSNSHSGKRYTRLESQILSVQSDEKTFLSNPEDLKDFENWKIGFDLEDKKEEIEMLLYDSDVLEEMVNKFIPDIVDYWTFWYRYFYKVHKARQAEEARAELVKRVISGEEEEELSWEVDDDDELEKNEGTQMEKAHKDGEKKREIVEIEKIEGTQMEKVEKDGEKKREIGGIEKIEGTQVENALKDDEIKRELSEMTEIEGIDLEKVEKDMVPKDEKLSVEKDKTEENVKEIENKDKHEEKEFSFSNEITNTDTKITNKEKVNLKNEIEDDLDWDEIEDLGEKDETKPGGSGANPNPNLKDDLRKRISVAEDDEDLSWDIEEEDDDEPKKR